MDNTDVVPSAAVFNLPKGKFRSETGSQTSISPSRIILRANISRIKHMALTVHLLVDARIKRIVDKRCQTTRTNVLPVKVRVILAFPTNPKTSEIRKNSRQILNVEGRT